MDHDFRCFYASREAREAEAAKLQVFLEFVLAQYVNEGVGELDQAKLPHLLELKYKGVSDAAEELGGVAKIRDAFIGFQRHLYGA